MPPPCISRTPVFELQKGKKNNPMYKPHPHLGTSLQVVAQAAHAYSFRSDVAAAAMQQSGGKEGRPSSSVIAYRPHS